MNNQFNNNGNNVCQTQPGFATIQPKEQKQFSKKISFVSKMCTMQFSKTDKGEIIFQMAAACGSVENNGKTLPKFDYTSKIYFGFNEAESADLVRTIEKFFFMPGKFTKTFFHKSGSDPKTINFEFDIDAKGFPQAKVSVNCDLGQNRRCSMFIKEPELEIIKQNLKCNYTL